ncbi:hypothetical protein GCM10017602_32300 [Herbiconiux flava]|nr:hypothetical protein GCM10017602_32300 [Herbiconiux flava]
MVPFYRAADWERKGLPRIRRCRSGRGRPTRSGAPQSLGAGSAQRVSVFRGSSAERASAPELCTAIVRGFARSLTGLTTLSTPLS